uniref:Internal scaffolding protein n=1 Tax=Dulem virus 104 TaxID=3145581 RepID=A0AAU8B8I1_9VIRU
MDFRTQFQPHDRVKANPGSAIKPVYSPIYDDNGVLDLEQTGQENLYDYIQSHKDSVDIHKILQRFQNGDVTALTKVQGMFGDFTEMPRTYAEALNSVIQAEHTFNSLPVETRAKFNHSFSQFLAKTGTEDWLSALGYKAADMAQAGGTPPGASVKAPPAAGAQDAPKGDDNK